MTRPSEDSTTVVNEYLAVVDQIITTFLDGHTAITWALRRATEPPEDAVTAPTDMMYYVGADHKRKRAVLREYTRAEFEERNRPNGSNIAFFGNMCLVALYQYWEDNFRARLARSLGIPTSHATIPVMGDVRHLRRAIIHNRAVALPQSEKGECLVGIRRGDPIGVNGPFAIRRPRNGRESVT